MPICAPEEMPIGLMVTEMWMREVVRFTGIATEKELEQLIEQETIQYFLEMKPALRDDNYRNRINRFRTSKILVCDELHRASQWSRLLMKEFDMPGGYLFPTEGGSEDGAVTAGVQAIAGTT